MVQCKDWRKTELDIDTVVLATGYRLERSLYDEISDIVGEVYLIGNANRPRKIVNAVHEGNKFALRELGCAEITASSRRAPEGVLGSDLDCSGAPTDISSVKWKICLFSMRCNVL